MERVGVGDWRKSRDPNFALALKRKELELEAGENENEKSRDPNFAVALFLTLLFVPEAGIEPAHPKVQDFESSASTSSATRALC